MRQLLAILLLIGLSKYRPSEEKGIIDCIAELDEKGKQMVQFAELEIDPNQLDAYLEFLKEEIQTSVNKEPGVLTLYSMADGDDPTKIKLVVVFANKAAYDAHIASAYFQKNGHVAYSKNLKLTLASRFSLQQKITSRNLLSKFRICIPKKYSLPDKWYGGHDLRRFYS